MLEDETGYYVYILRCADNTLYTGWTTNPKQRLAVHNRGKGAKYTRSRLPVHMLYLEQCADENAARKRECAVKAMTRQQKLALIEEDATADKIYRFGIDLLVF